MTGIQTAINHMGSASKLARAIGVSTQAVCFYRDGLRKIPAETCILIERCTDGLVCCEDLRPDVAWEYLRPKLAQGGTSVEQAAIKTIAEA